MLCVAVKADAYGHGAIEVARVAKRRGAQVILGGAAATPLAESWLPRR